MQNMMPVPPPPFRLKTSPTVMMAAPISQANVQQTTFPTFVNPPVSQPPAVSMPPTVSMHPSTPFTVAVATGGSEALAATTASRRETANIYEMMLQETRPKRQAETEPLLGAPIQTNNTINFYNAENYTMGTNTVNMSSVGTVGMGNSNSNNTSNNTTGVQRNIAADPPPFAFSANSRAVQEMPKIVEYKMSTGFVQESSIPPFEKNMGFMTPPERPGAPSPSGNQDSMSAPTSTSISTIIKQAEAFLQTNSEPTERKSIEPLINLIEFEEAQKHIEELCKTHGLCRDYNKDGSLVFGPAGKRIKDNIVQLWIEKMVNQPQETLGTGGGVIFEMETPLYFNVANTKNVQCPISICQNTECGFVADTVAFIHERSNNEIQYDGSSLDQLLKKQEMVNPKCPKCDSGTLGEPLMGYKEVPIFIGGTCMDATKEDGSRIVDPSIYKVNPSSLLKQQLKLRDPMEELTKKEDLEKKEEPEKEPPVKDADKNDADGNEKTLVLNLNKPPKDKEEATESPSTALVATASNDKEEGETLKAAQAAQDTNNKEKTPPNIVTHLLASSWKNGLIQSFSDVSSIWGGQNVLGLYQVGNTVSCQIGQLYNKQASEIYNTRTSTDMTIVYDAAKDVVGTEITLGGGETYNTFLSEIQDEKIYFLTKEDQYLKRNASKKSFGELIKYITSRFPPSKTINVVKLGQFFGITLSNILSLVKLVVHNNVAENFVFRELLPNELTQHPGSVKWQLESRFFKYERECKNHFALISLDKGQYVSVETKVETLFYYALLHGQRRDKSRKHVYSALNFEIAPWKVAIAHLSASIAPTLATALADSGKVEKVIKCYTTSLKQNGLSVVQVPQYCKSEEEVVEWCDKLGIPFLLMIDEGECNSHNSVFEIPVTVRNRDTKEKIEKSYMDVAVYIGNVCLGLFK